VLNAFKNTAAAQASGLRLAGQKYFVLQVTDRSIYGKKQVRLSPLRVSAIGLMARAGGRRGRRADEAGGARV
jgi:hypothetical protein